MDSGIIGNKSELSRRGETGIADRNKSRKNSLSSPSRRRSSMTNPSRDLVPINAIEGEPDNNSTTSSEVAAAAEKSRRLREMMEKKREANIVSALRLIRQASVPVGTTVMSTQPTKKKKKKKKEQTARERQLSILRNIGSEEQLVLHDIKDMHKEAYAAYHHRTKTSPMLARMEEIDSSAAILKARRPQSASLIAEIVADESAKARQRFREQKERAKKRQAALEAWSSFDGVPLPLEGGFGEFSSTEMGESDVLSRRHPMLPDSTVSSNMMHGEGSSFFARPSTADGSMSGPHHHSTGRKKQQQDGREEYSSTKKTSSAATAHRDKAKSKTEPRRVTIRQQPAPGLSLRRRTEIKSEMAEMRARQEEWLKVVALLARNCELADALTNKRKAKFQKAVKKMQTSAVRRLELFWQSHRILSTMRRNPEAVNRIRIFALNYIRLRKVVFRRQCVHLISSFISDISGVSDRTQKIYRYRAKVVRVQRWVKGYIACQPARLQILWMSLERELTRKRIARNRQLSENERKSIRKMKNTDYFGATVQKLDDTYSNLASLMTLKAQTYKALMQKQRHVENLSSSRNLAGSKHKKGQPAQKISRRYMVLLRNVLKMQRRRHILCEDNEQRVHSKASDKQAVDEKDVKEFLTTPNHPGPSFILQSVEQSWEKKPVQFLLLTGGALRELESLAYDIVLSQEDSKRGDGKSYFSGISSMVSEEETTHAEMRVGRRGESPSRDMEYLFDEEEDDW